MKTFIYSLTLITILTNGCGVIENEEETKNIINPINEGSWYKPTLETSWQWQLKDTINTSYNVTIYDIDLFDASKETIKSLKNDGKKVICYFSAGSYEDWREDKDLFNEALLGKDLDGWEGEKWLDISNENLHTIMIFRLDLAKEKGCDGVEPDNMDGYSNDSGFALSATDQLEYNKFIANEAHNRGLSVGLKNDVDQIVELEPYFDFSVNEQCHQYNECENMQPFIDANKPVFNAEYNQDYVDNTDNKRDTICAQSQELQLQTLILPLNLDGSFRISCE